MKFLVLVREVTDGTVEIEADTAEEACSKVETAHRSWVNWETPDGFEALSAEAVEEE